jgi:hypothetical protein
MWSEWLELDMSAMVIDAWRRVEEMRGMSNEHPTHCPPFYTSGAAQPRYGVSELTHHDSWWSSDRKWLAPQHCLQSSLREKTLSSSFGHDNLTGGLVFIEIVLGVDALGQP